MATVKFHNQLIAGFQDFRKKLYNCFQLSSDACIDLLDALAGNTGAKSNFSRTRVYLPTKYNKR
jgi:hypothetical protein